MKPVRILIADDHELIRSGLRSLLRLRAGWEVCGEATNGQEAVEQVRQLNPDVIVLDITMPVLNGLEAARLISKEAPQTAIVILSQHAPQGMSGRAFEAGAQAYVSKSDVASELLTTIDSVLKRDDHRPRHGSNSASG